MRLAHQVEVSATVGAISHGLLNAPDGKGLRDPLLELICNTFLTDSYAFELSSLSLDIGQYPVIDNQAVF